MDLKIIKELDGKLLYEIKEGEQLDSLFMLFHPAATSSAAQLDSGVPADASTHAWGLKAKARS